MSAHKDNHHHGHDHHKDSHHKDTHHKDAHEKGSHAELEAIHPAFKSNVLEIGGWKVDFMGDSPKVIIYFGDIYGFHSGHTQKTCSDLANLGYTVANVDWLFGLPWREDLPLGHEFQTWASKIRVRESIEFVQDNLLPRLKAEDKTDFAVAGSCAGAWISLHVSAAIPEIKANISFHPSYIIEQYHGGDIKTVMAKVTQPQIIFPAHNDPVDIKPNGELIHILEKSTGGKVESHPHESEQHGYMNRADLKVPHSAKAYNDTLIATGQFLKKYL